MVVGLAQRPYPAGQHAKQTKVLTWIITNTIYTHTPSCRPFTYYKKLQLIKCAAWGAGLRRRLASHLALPLRRGDGDGAVVVVVTARLLANEVLDLAAVLWLPMEGRRLERYASVGHHVLRSGIPTSFYAKYRK